MIEPDDQHVEVGMLEGNFLDNAVLLALGLNAQFDGKTAVAFTPGQAPTLVVGDPNTSPFLRSFCREWSVGGPLIEQYRIDITWKNVTWFATFRGATSFGATPLEAAMRALVQHKITTGEVLHSFRGMTRAEALQQMYRRPPESMESDSPEAPESK
jgi:hypothetical protein